MPCYLKDTVVGELVSKLTRKYKVEQDNNFIEFLDKNMTEIYDEEKKDHETVERGVLENVRKNPRGFEMMLESFIFAYSRKLNIGKDELKGVIRENKSWYIASKERESESSRQEEIPAYA